MHTLTWVCNIWHQLTNTPTAHAIDKYSAAQDKSDGSFFFFLTEKSSSSNKDSSRIIRQEWMESEVRMHLCMYVYMCLPCIICRYVDQYVGSGNQGQKHKTGWLPYIMRKKCATTHVCTYSPQHMYVRVYPLLCVIHVDHTIGAEFHSLTYGWHFFVEIYMCRYIHVWILCLICCFSIWRFRYACMHMLCRYIWVLGCMYIDTCVCIRIHMWAFTDIYVLYVHIYTYMYI